MSGGRSDSTKSGYGTLSSLLTQQVGRPVLTGTRIRDMVERGRYDVVNFHNARSSAGPGCSASLPTP